MKSGKIHHSSFTLQTFFSKFDLFAEVPDAVTKMRELVLELAVRGSLFSSGHPCMTAPSAPFPIPKHWQWVALNNAANCRAVTKVDSSSLKDSDWVLDLEDIDGGAGKVIATVTYAQRRSLSTKAAFQAGDVLYGKLRPYLNKVVVAERSGFCTTEIIPLRPHAFLAPGYLRLFLRSPHFLRYAAAKNYGMKMPRLGTTDLESSKLPLPPLTEQRRIVAKVDELMSLCDRLEAQQKERDTRHAALARASLARFADAPTPANLDFLFHSSFSIAPSDLRKSILTLAVQGKLVHFDTVDEEQTVGDHIEFVNGYAFKSEWFKPSGIRLCRNTNVSHGILDWRETAFVDNKVAKEFERFALSEGDIVLSLDRPLIATGLKVARVTKADLPCLLLQRVAKPIPKHNQLDLSYFMIWLKSSEFVNSIDPGRSNGVPHISTRQVQRIPFILPPLAEQRRIVAKVDELMALVDELEARLAASRAAGEKLLAALVAELTTGKKSPA